MSHMKWRGFGRVIQVVSSGAFTLGCGVATLAAASEAQRAPELSEVVVTASPLRESALEIAQPTTIVQGDTLVRERGVTLADSLATVPGVSSTWFGPQASRPVIRGQSGERVQIYEDGGESLDVAALSNDHAVTVDPLIADRLEVLRGPATLLYGNGASAGIVNVVSERIPQRALNVPFKGAIEIRGDEALEERAVAAKFTGGNERWVFHGDAFKRDTDDVQVADFGLSKAARESGEFTDEEIEASRGKIANSASDLQGGSFGISRVGERGFIGVSVSRFETAYGIPGPGEEEAEEEVPTVEKSNERVRAALSSGEAGGVSIDMLQTRYDLAAEWRPESAAINAVRVRATRNDYEHAEVEPSGEIGTQFDQKGFDARVNIDHAEWLGWRGTFGFQVRDIDFVAEGAEAFVPPSKTQNFGAFLFEERDFGRLTLELGARLEQQEVEPDNGATPYDDSFVNLAAGAIWRLTDTWRTAVNVTSTKRHPSATELYADGPHLAVRRFEIGDETLREERANTLDVSLRHQSAGSQFSITAYVADYSDYIYANPTSEVEDGLPVVRFVQEDARFVGLEAEWQLPSVAFGTGKLESRLMADLTRGELDAGGDLPQIPPMRFGAEFRYALARLSAGISAVYNAKQDDVANNELPTDSFTLLGADVSFRTPLADRELLVYVRGSNLLDEDARRHASPLKEFAPLPGRSVGLGVRFEF